MGVTAHWIDPDLGNNCARKSAALACRRLVGSHTADLILSEIESILQEYEVMTKVTKIVTDGGANFVCAFKERPPSDAAESEDLDLESLPISVTSLREILNAYNGNDYTMRPHQRCASHRFNNVMNADIEAAAKKNSQLYLNGDRSEHVLLGRKFFDLYDGIIKECQKLWHKQQRSTVQLHLLYLHRKC